jgi:hypothetical protein
MDDVALRPEHESKDLVFDNMKLLIHYDVIYYGLVHSPNFAEDKGQRLLNDVKEEVKTMYKGNVGFMLKQSNLEKNCLDKFLRVKITKIIDNYNTKISS